MRLELLTVWAWALRETIPRANILKGRKMLPSQLKFVPRKGKVSGLLYSVGQSTYGAHPDASGWRSKLLPLMGE